MDDEIIPMRRAEVEEMISRLDQSQIRMAEARESYDKARRSSETRTKWKRIMTAVLAALCLIAIVLSFNAVEASNRAQRALRLQEQDRLERARGNCVQFNVKQQADRLALVTAAHKAILPEGVEVSVERRAAAEDFLKRYEQEIATQLPYRDCSDTGIDQYQKNPPEDPATKENL